MFNSIRERCYDPLDTAYHTVIKNGWPELSILYIHYQQAVNTYGCFSYSRTMLPFR